MFQTCVKDSRLLLLRGLSVLVVRKMSAGFHKQQSSELQIPVPWGHIAAKTWGDPSTGRPVLGLHGWLDNCHSLLPIAEKMSRDLFFIIIDFPGHGRSSHRPHGVPYYFMDYVCDVRRIVEYFRWDKFSIIGHSLGANVGLVFSASHPKRVENLVMLDVLVPFARPVDEAPGQVADAAQQLIDYEKNVDNRQPKVYKEVEALERILKGSMSELSPDAAKILLERGSSPYTSPDGKTSGLILNRDFRVKLRSPISYSLDHYKAFASNLTANLLVIRAHNDKWPRNNEKEEEFKEIFKKNCKKFVYEEVEGEHHIHLTHHEVVLPHISKFMLDVGLADNSKI